MNSLKNLWKYILILLAFLSSTSVQAQVLLNGHLTNVSHNRLFIDYYSLSDVHKRAFQRDTIVLQNGRFQKEVKMAPDAVGAVLYDSSTPNRQRRLLFLPLFKHATITLTGSLDDCRITGDSFYQQYNEVRAMCHPFEISLNEAADAILHLRANGELTRSRMDSIRTLFLPAQQSLKKVRIDYIRQHSNDDIAVYLLAAMGTEAGEYFSLIGDKAKNGRLATMYHAMEAAFKQEKLRFEARKKIVEGIQAPEFTLPDVNGHQVTLSSLLGKYLILDFWGSWCGWCIKGIPQMKQYYEKYKEQMEILGINCQDTSEKWKDTLVKYQLPWLQVRNTSSVNLPEQYGIQGYPTKIILNPQGEVIKIFVGEDESFYTFLDNLFKLSGR